MEQITAYLKETKRTKADMARELGVSKSYMTELCSGEKTPGLQLALRIQAATGGLVPATSWLRSPSSAPQPGQS